MKNDACGQRVDENVPLRGFIIRFKNVAVGEISRHFDSPAHNYYFPDRSGYRWIALQRLGEIRQRTYRKDSYLMAMIFQAFQEELGRSFRLRLPGCGGQVNARQRAPSFPPLGRKLRITSQ